MASSGGVVFDLGDIVCEKVLACGLAVERWFALVAVGSGFGVCVCFW